MDVNDRVAGALLRNARAQAGMTQVEFAELLGITQSTLSAYECGRRQPTLPTLLRLLTRAGVDLIMRLEQADGHDESLATWERAQSPERREELRADGFDLVSDR